MTGKYAVCTLMLALSVLFCKGLYAVDLEQGIQQLAVELSSQMKTGSVKKIAVIEFTDLNGYQSALGQFLAEELVTQLLLASPGQLDVVERRQLAKVLAEQKFTTSGLLDPDTIANVGRILGINAIVTGSIADLGEEVKINARVISVESARIFAAAGIRIGKSGVVSELLRQNPGASRLASPSSGSPPPGRQVQRSDVYFQNSFLRIDIASISRLADKKRVSLSLVFENISKNDLMLLLGNKDGKCKVTLTDNLGTDVQAEEVTGVPCVHWIEDPKHREAYGVFAPSARSTVVVSFVSSQPIEGNLFSLAIDFFRFDNERWSKFSAGIPNIELK